MTKQMEKFDGFTNLELMEVLEKHSFLCKAGELFVSEEYRELKRRLKSEDEIIKITLEEEELVKLDLEEKELVELDLEVEKEDIEEEK